MGKLIVVFLVLVLFSSGLQQEEEVCNKQRKNNIQRSLSDTNSPANNIRSGIVKAAEYLYNCNNLCKTIKF